MERTAKRVVGIYKSEQEAIAAVEDLKNQGYATRDISIIGQDRKEVDRVTEETDTEVVDGIATGALTGGALGGLTGLLAGAGALAIPGIGPIVAAGPIAAVLTGAVTGAGVGGLTGALVEIGLSKDEAEYYGNSVKEGNILVLVDEKEQFSKNTEQKPPLSRRIL
ncbi:general stress protein [Priestia megaterium]|uniref:General stress protein n=1 Tax=Priestia megaterium TaxID=1404 RepID=A0A6M6DTV4_PRIMG|nr:general stress protein [Priestia megaterium]MCJ7988391.1 general stress protein [Priestia sp. OVS21]MCE4090791.1 general stress protein [Priestia megaterium]MDH3160412.1 general stress protein [Priestia megaterium]MDH3187629.1 general stress protein [Priestia megaterium]MDQ0804266.1 putative membrane protein [Priestia megaterium]